MDYQDFLIQKHRKLSTPFKILNEAVKKATGFPVFSSQRLVLGGVNEVYDVQTKDGKSVIVRISHDEHPGFEREKWAIEQCAKEDIPVPRILLIYTAKGENKNLTVCVESKLAGIPLGTLIKEGAVREEKVKRYLKEAGSLLSKIHAIKSNGFGFLDGNGQGEFQTWEDVVLKYSVRKEKLLERAGRWQISPDAIVATLSILENHRNLYKQVTEGQLIHEDFGPEHIFVDNGKIVGIIDLENCIGGDPMMDFSWWDFFYGRNYPVKLLLEGYENKRVLENFELKLHLYRLHRGLFLLQYYDDENNPHGIEITKRNLSLDLSFF